jgi:hypothetical protein
VCDEGVYANAFRVVEAPARLAVATSMRQHPPISVGRFPTAQCIVGGGRDGQWSAEALLQRIDATWVDDDSRYTMSVYAITTIEQCEPDNGTRVQEGQG